MQLEGGEWWPGALMCCQGGCTQAGRVVACRSAELWHGRRGPVPAHPAAAVPYAGVVTLSEHNGSRTTAGLLVWLPDRVAAVVRTFTWSLPGSEVAEYPCVIHHR
jgi:hypothetical protein